MKTFTCNVAQKGFYAGPVYFIRREETEEKTISDPKAELEKLNEAAARLKLSIEENQGSGKNAAIRETVLSFLSDAAFMKTAERNIKEQRLDAATAVRRAAEDIAKELGSVDSEYIRSRRDDVRGVAEKIVLILNGTDDGLKVLSAICAKEISPAQLSSMEENLIGGMLTEKGSPNSHASILAGNIGIPYLYGNREAVEEAGKASYLILDSESATAIIDPDETVRKDAEKRMEVVRAKRAAEAAEAEESPVFCHTKVYANIEGPQDIEALLSSGADGVGLFRTEFLFLGKDRIPTEEEQFETYKAVLEAMGDKEVIIRTMDIGSDKKAPWLDIPEETNPALGMRGARVSLECRELFRTQLRALLRAGVYGNLKVMFPMITSGWEIDEIKERVRETAEELEKERNSFKLPALGIMVETPAAAVCAEELAEKVDFFSIGTNDLTQYTLALDREARGLDRYFKPHHEAVFKLIQMTAEGGHKHGVVTGVCGQLAADPEAVERLIKAGVDELSVAVRKVKATKKLASKAEKNLKEQAVSKVQAVADGELIPMEEIPDPVFAGGSMGECFGILPSNGNVYAPVTGTILNVAETGHAVTLQAEDGQMILVHVGIDTVSLGGKAFNLHVKVGDQVAADQLLMEADLDMIGKAGLSTMIIVVALNA